MKMFVAIVATALVTASAPALADAVVDYARNSGKVDGFSAVGAGTNKRANKLVATNGKGRLPDYIVSKVDRATAARNASYAGTAGSLMGYTEDAFVKTCQALGGWAAVTPASLTAEWKKIGGYNCRSDEIQARRVEAGVYQLWFDQLPPLQGCDVTNFVPSDVIASVTPNDTRSLSIEYHAVEDTASRRCGSSLSSSYSLATEVTIRDANGDPVDANFTYLLLNS